MIVEVVMPKLGMAMKEGIVSIWHKRVGDSISEGEIIANINSEKIEMEFESPASGTLLEIIVPEGEGVPPGTVICYLGDPNEKVSKITRSVSNVELQEQEVTKTAANLEINPLHSLVSVQPKVELKSSPIARKMAEAAGIDIESIQGTGPQGRVTKEDVEIAIANKSSTEFLAASATTEDVILNNDAYQVEQTRVTGIRKVIATRMLDSLRNSAQLTLMLTADVTDLISLQKQMSETAQKQHDIKLTVTDFIARAVVLSIAQHRQINSAYIDERIYTFGHVHLGIAVALEKGLVVPVIRHAEKYSLLDLSQHIKSLAQRSRNGQLGSEEMQGSTFTITNLGTYGIEHFTPILNTPEAGILGVGTVHDTPIYIGEDLQRRNLLPLSLTFDHRVLDGAPAAEFFCTLKQYLEHPLRMVL